MFGEGGGGKPEDMFKNSGINSLIIIIRIAR